VRFKAILHRCVNLPEPFKSEIFPPQLHGLLAERKDIGGILSLPNKGERIFLIAILRNLLTPKEYGHLFVEQWNYSENPGCTYGKDTPKLWEGIPREYMMGKKEMRVYEALPDIVTIYRGVSSIKKGRDRVIRGFSWTLNKERGKWFALRFTHDGLFITAAIPKEHIIFYCDDRKEQEIVVNPKFLKIKSKEMIKNEI